MLLSETFEEVAAIAKGKEAYLVFADPKKKELIDLIDKGGEELWKKLCSDYYLCECMTELSRKPLCLREYETENSKIVCRMDEVKGGRTVICLSDRPMGLVGYKNTFEFIEKCLKEYS
jgi:hypothetical protein